MQSIPADLSAPPLHEVLVADGLDQELPHGLVASRQSFGSKLPLMELMRIELKQTTGLARKYARILDSAFRVPGTRFRFGIDPLLGLVPGLGDAIGGAFAFYLLTLAARAGAPPVVMLRMFTNIVADLLLGAIPILGDVLDAGYKANVRNLGLLERYIDRPEETKKQSLLLLMVLFGFLLAILSGTLWLTLAALEAFLNSTS